MDSLRAPEAKLTVEDYLHFPDDGLRHELIDGVHWMSPAPSYAHQVVLGELFARLREMVKLTGLGDVLLAPLDVELSRWDIVQPDLIVVLRERLHIKTKARLVGAPDLLVEILSPSNPEQDRERKWKLYAAAGVREYWIVDPEARLVEQMLLDQGRWGPVSRHTDEIALGILPDVRLDLRGVWPEA